MMDGFYSAARLHQSPQPIIFQLIQLTAAASLTLGERQSDFKQNVLLFRQNQVQTVFSRRRCRFPSVPIVLVSVCVLKRLAACLYRSAVRLSSPFFPVKKVKTVLTGRNFYELLESHL